MVFEQRLAESTEQQVIWMDFEFHLQDQEEGLLRWLAGYLTGVVEYLVGSLMHYVT